MGVAIHWGCLCLPPLTPPSLLAEAMSLLPSEKGVSACKEGLVSEGQGDSVGRVLLSNCEADDV